ncbi:hypothetical protein LAWI1_G007450 [Lachnellula willkommii]|uniref:Transcription factor RfeG n=1 Tax=Lachnellula willkommii TaxID=215461 RepID=A0A559M0G2_9HELO|nr:hypothetical protein LAWI1_G007450 [Lachnellula willkommii]
MSGRDRERDRRAAAQPQPVRMSTLYLGMVSTERSLPPTSVGTWGTMLSYGLNPSTRQIQQGYFITAYRNLTTAMIADLKADSDRWEAERRSTQSRGQPSNVEYRASTTHQSRQYYGPTEAATGMSTPGYAPAAPSGNVAQGAYAQNYPPPESYAPPVSSGYANPPSTYSQQDNNYYVAGANMETIRPLPQPGTVPRTGQPYGTTPTYAQRDANAYYSPQPPATSVSSSQYPSNPSDPYYGRVTPVTGTYDSQDYDSRPYQDNGAYNQAQMTPQSTTATSGSSNRPRERERDSDRERRHRHR